MFRLILFTIVVAATGKTCCAKDSEFQLESGERIYAGNWISSPDGSCKLVLHKSGQLSWKYGDVTLWQCPVSADEDDGLLYMHKNGNLVLYNLSPNHGTIKIGSKLYKPIWESKTSGHEGAYLQCQDDGNLVLLKERKAVWESGSKRPGKGHVAVSVPKGSKLYFRNNGKYDESILVSDGTYKASTTNDLIVGEPGYSFTIKVEYYDGRATHVEERKIRLFAYTTVQVDLSDIASPSKKDRTLWYWREMQVIVSEWMSHQPKDLARALKSICKEIDDLPVRHVDEEAVEVIADYRDAMMKFAIYLEENSGLGRNVEAFARGYNGDPFGVAAEIAADQKAITKAFENADAKANRIRKKLTTRYDIEFPALK